MKASTSQPLDIVATDLGSPTRWLSKLACAIWGHEVDNHRFRSASPSRRRCRCGAPYLVEDGSTTHVRHTLSCFLGHHTYARLGDRAGHHEYVCIQCGHPLLFEATRDPYVGSEVFAKKVRYRCGLFGHRVRHVIDRDGFAEYACHCGHTFLKARGQLEHITHPLICVVSGHRIRFVTEREGYSEYVCNDCGHPFCFSKAEGS